MITSLLVQDDTCAPITLCKANPHFPSKHAAACYAAQAAFLRTVFGYQPTKGLIAGYVSSVAMEGSIVAVEVAFREYGYATGMFEVPVHAIKFDGQSVSTTSDAATWIGQSVVLKVINRYKLDGIFLSNVAAISIDGGDKWVEPPRESLAKLEA
ncbi:hypothetical protein QPK31_23790 [Massilia sp. YIM B02769]|uniref:hypothetical protein n=1 Tax=Massilia sp. YIM B02769 TaxID=3050129 RepID=UPI0025B62C75|nr:hypothetical protein [Massilia sp. YIM B02769]MDN4061247.1 hypothetical protein [Massilia sp. YIM B02769]